MLDRMPALPWRPSASRKGEDNQKLMSKGTEPSRSYPRPVRPLLHGPIWLLCIMLLLGLPMAGPAPVQAAERHVCTSCTYKTIQAAVNASSSGDVIKVAQGTYYEKLYIENRAITLLGGYSPADWNTQGPASSTVVNATGKNDAVITVLNAGVTIDNFTITGGIGRYSDWHGWRRGGGLFIWADNNPSVVISDNIIEGNSAGEGGGVCVEGVETQPLSAQLLRNVIRNNSANVYPRWGGGLTLIYTTAILQGSTISNNTAKWGGGFHIWKSAPTIDGNVITGNIAHQSTERVGGAFFIERSSAFIKNNIIAGNQAADYAAGIYIKIPYPDQPQPQIVNNTIVANSTHGIVVRDSINPIIRNNIIALNGVGLWRYDGIVPVMSNNDVWGNGQNYVNLPPGTNDISANPLFVDQAGGDYHLSEGSPCIDTGTSSNAPPSDFEGDLRPLDGNLDGTALWDIGADEYENPVWITKEVSPAHADPGDTIVYTITYRNQTGSAAHGVEIKDAISSDLQNLSFDPHYDSKTGNTYSWDIGELGPGSSGTITIEGRIDPSLATPATILNTAEFDAAETGPFSDDALTVVGGLKTGIPLVSKAH